MMDPVYNLKEGMRIRFQHRQHRPNISTSAIHRSLREPISREVVVTMSLAYPNHQVSTSQVSLQSI